MLNSEPGAKDHIAGARVVAAYKGGSQDIESSISRVDQYAEEIRTKYGVEIVPDIATLLSKVDAVLLSSVDGRAHLAQARPAIAAHKPLFIDKPLASTLEDAREIARLAKEAGVPWFSSSSLRFGEIGRDHEIRRRHRRDRLGPGTARTAPRARSFLVCHPPHRVALYAAGPGMRHRHANVDAEGADVIVGRWKDGRIGTVRAIRPYSDYGAVVFRAKEIVEAKPQGARQLPRRW